MPFTTLTRKDYFPSPRTQVVVYRQHRQGRMKRHRHEFRELVVILSGEGLHNLNGRRHRIGRGDVLFIDEHSTHAYEETRDLNLVNLLISPQTIDRMEADLSQLPGYRILLAPRGAKSGRPFNRVHVHEAELDQLADWIDRMEAELGAGSGAGYIVAEAYLKVILAMVLRRFEHEGSAKGELDRLKATVSWMEAHLAEGMTIPALARRAGLSERNFYRRFHAMTGTSPANYILQARLRKAAGLLKRDPEGSCRDIARRCGFKDPNYFSTAFRKRYGASPKAASLSKSSATARRSGGRECARSR